MRPSFLGGATCGILLALSASVANAADPNFRFATDQTTYSVAPGSFVDVSVYLEEQLNGATTPLIVSAGGLEFFGFGSVRSSGNLSVTSQAANPLFNMGPSGNQYVNSLGFTFPSPDNDFGTALGGGVDLHAYGVMGGFVDNPIDQDYRIYLGKLRVSAPLTGGVTSVFYLRDLDELIPTDSGSPTLLALDGIFSPDNPGYSGQPASTWSPNTTSFSVVVTPVPEPASLALLAAGGACLLVRRRRN